MHAACLPNTSYFRKELTFIAEATLITALEACAYPVHRAGKAAPPGTPTPGSEPRQPPAHTTALPQPGGGAAQP